MSNKSKTVTHLGQRGAKPATRAEKTPRQPRKARKLSDFATACSRDAEAFAKSDYVDGELHQTFHIAEFLTASVDRTADDLAAGRIPAHIPLACCKGTFVTILSASPSAPYTEVYLPEGGDRVLSAAETARLDAACECGYDTLAKALEDFGCSTDDTASLYQPDSARQTAYRDALIRLVEAGLRLACRRGGKSSRATLGFVEALRLLQPAALAHGASPLGINEDQAGRAYDALLAAHAALWADDYLANLKAKGDRN